jgi:hypothetical protein
MVGTAVNVAVAVRPARIMTPGTSAPMNGSNAMMGRRLLCMVIRVSKRSIFQVLSEKLIRIATRFARKTGLAAIAQQRYGGWNVSLSWS